MVAISFGYRQDFPELILAGKKNQTIRPYNEKRFEQIKRIKKLQLYWKQRTKKGYKIGDAELEDIFIIMLSPDKHITMWDERTNRWWGLHGIDEWEIIKRDGFRGKEEFFGAFHKMYGDKMYSMKFMIIRFRLKIGDRNE